MFSFVRMLSIKLMFGIWNEIFINAQIRFVITVLKSEKIAKYYVYGEKMHPVLKISLLKVSI